MTDNQSNVIVGYGVFTQSNDNGLLISMIKRVRQIVGPMLNRVFADTAYCSILDLKDSRALGVELFAPVQDNQQQAGRKAANGQTQISSREFGFTPSPPEMTCPQGHPMKLIRTAQATRWRSPIAQGTSAPRQTCSENGHQTTVNMSGKSSSSNSTSGLPKPSAVAEPALANVADPISNGCHLKIVAKPHGATYLVAKIARNETGTLKLNEVFAHLLVAFLDLDSNLARKTVLIRSSAVELSMSSSSSRSIAVDHVKVLELRQELGWTQEHAAEKAGYSSRLIRKLEAGSRVRPATLVDILQCYHVALGIGQWRVGDFLRSANGKNASPEGIAGQVGEVCEADQQRQILRMREWYKTMYERRDVSRLEEFIAPSMKYQHGEGPIRVGVEFIRELVDTVLTGFDPMQFDFPHSFYSDGYVHTFWRMKMKHAGDFGGVPATGKWMTCRGNSQVKLADGKMIDAEDNWPVYDIINELKGEGPRLF